MQKSWSQSRSAIFFHKPNLVNLAELDDILALNKNDRIVELELCESELAEAIEVFDEEKCMNGEYDGEYE